MDFKNMFRSGTAKLGNAVANIAETTAEKLRTDPELMELIQISEQIEKVSSLINQIPTKRNSDGKIAEETVEITVSKRAVGVLKSLLKENEKLQKLINPPEDPTEATVEEVSVTF